MKKKHDIYVVNGNCFTEEDIYAVIRNIFSHLEKKDVHPDAATVALLSCILSINRNNEKIYNPLHTLLHSILCNFPVNKVFVNDERNIVN